MILSSHIECDTFPFFPVYNYTDMCLHIDITIVIIVVVINQKKRILERIKTCLKQKSILIVVMCICRIVFLFQTCLHTVFIPLERMVKGYFPPATPFADLIVIMKAQSYTCKIL